jgi:lipid II:glycine glycyltransferase (peptidoglycan interpeptide bridge formation enzyme)
MIRTNAAKEFFISSSDFQRFFRNNQTLSLICTVYSNGQAISSELVLVSDKTIYSFLGGTSVEHFDKRPNDLLKFELISWCRTNGKKYFILGGGLGEDDGIFKYKKSFFPNDVVQFYTGRKIIDKEKYKSLLDECNLFRRDLGFQELDINDTSFFPLYRKQN